MRTDIDPVAKSWTCFSEDLLRALILIALLITMGCPPLLAQQSYLQNGDFSSDVDGWSLLGDEGETMDWDGMNGSPHPGSLRLTAVNSFFVGPIALGECVAAPENSTWELTAMSRVAPGSVELGCGLMITVHTIEDCSDGIHAFVSGNTGAGNDWTPLDLAFQVPAGCMAIRAALAMPTGIGANGSCHIDSVRLLGPPSLDVPTLDHTGMIALITALALAGGVLLRRVR